VKLIELMIALMQDVGTTRYLPQHRRQSLGHVPIASIHDVRYYDNDLINELKGGGILQEPGFVEQLSDLPMSHHSQRRRSMGDSPLFFRPGHQTFSQLDGLLGQFTKENNNCIEPSICTSMSNTPSFDRCNKKKIQPKKRKSKSQKKVRSDYSDLWNLNFQKLLQFRQKHNHCVVPCDYDADPSLARWVKRQRHLYHLLSKGKNSSLKPDRISMLNNISFSWDAKDALWQERLKDLKEFKKAQGHCVVPTIFPLNQPLATWVKFQRRQYKLYQENSPSYMTPERIKSLEDLDFEWTLRSSKPTEIDAKEQKCWIEIMSDLTSDCEDDGDCSGEPVQKLLTDLFQEHYEQDDSQNDDDDLSGSRLQTLLDEFSSDLEDGISQC